MPPETSDIDIVDDLRQHPVTIAQEAADEIVRLRRWKAEAIEVIRAWDDVWVALGQPGELGESKPIAALRTVINAPA